MNFKRMGRTGLKVSEVCLGTMTFGKQSDEPTAFAILDLAAGAGVNFIDTADVYPVPPSLDLVGRTEEIVGKWIKGKRDQFVWAQSVATPWAKDLMTQAFPENIFWRRSKPAYA